MMKWLGLIVLISFIKVLWFNWLENKDKDSTIKIAIRKKNILKKTKNTLNFLGVTYI